MTEQFIKCWIKMEGAYLEQLKRSGKAVTSELFIYELGPVMIFLFSLSLDLYKGRFFCFSVKDF
jgi:hypothetical protein